MLLRLTLVQKVARDHEKNFDFPKQHAVMHAPDDIRRKGATKNFSTRPGEGFQQEVREAFGQTNFREVLGQVSVLPSL